jgi:hypothetical protein
MCRERTDEAKKTHPLTDLHLPTPVLLLPEKSPPRGHGTRSGGIAHTQYKERRYKYTVFLYRCSFWQHWKHCTDFLGTGTGKGGTRTENICTRTALLRTMEMQRQKQRLGNGPQRCLICVKGKLLPARRDVYAKRPSLLVTVSEESLPHPVDNKNIYFDAFSPITSRGAYDR